MVLNLDNEFDNVSEKICKSYTSSAIDLIEDHILEKDRILPFDFEVTRKAKWFMKESLIDLTGALLEKKYNQTNSYNHKKPRLNLVESENKRVFDNKKPRDQEE